MSTFNNVLGNFISYSNDLSDPDDDDYEDSGSEPEPEMGTNYNTNLLSRSNAVDERTQFVESLQSKLSKHTCIRIQIHKKGFLFMTSY
jgi:hypothetical protein